MNELEFEQIMKWVNSEDCPCELDEYTFMNCCGKNLDIFKETKEETCLICGRSIDVRTYSIGLFSGRKNKCPNCKQGGELDE